MSKLNFKKLSLPSRTGWFSSLSDRFWGKPSLNALHSAFDIKGKSKQIDLKERAKTEIYWELDLDYNKPKDGTRLKKEQVAEHEQTLESLTKSIHRLTVAQNKLLFSPVDIAISGSDVFIKMNATLVAGLYKQLFTWIPSGKALSKYYLKIDSEGRMSFVNRKSKTFKKEHPGGLAFTKTTLDAALNEKPAPHFLSSKELTIAPLPFKEVSLTSLIFSPDSQLSADDKAKLKQQFRIEDEKSFALFDEKGDPFMVSVAEGDGLDRHHVAVEAPPHAQVGQKVVLMDEERNQPLAFKIISFRQGPDGRTMAILDDHDTKTEPTYGDMAMVAMVVGGAVSDIGLHISNNKPKTLSPQRAQLRKQGELEPGIGDVDVRHVVNMLSDAASAVSEASLSFFSSLSTVLAPLMGALAMAQSNGRGHGLANPSSGILRTVTSALASCASYSMAQTTEPAPESIVEPEDTFLHKFNEVSVGLTLLLDGLLKSLAAPDALTGVDLYGANTTAMCDFTHNLNVSSCAESLSNNAFIPSISIEARRDMVLNLIDVFQSHGRLELFGKTLDQALSIGGPVFGVHGWNEGDPTADYVDRLIGLKNLDYIPIGPEFQNYFTTGFGRTTPESPMPPSSTPHPPSTEESTSGSVTPVPWIVAGGTSALLLTGVCIYVRHRHNQNKVGFGNLSSPEGVMHQLFVSAQLESKFKAERSSGSVVLEIPGETDVDPDITVARPQSDHLSQGSLGLNTSNADASLLDGTGAPLPDDERTRLERDKVAFTKDYALKMLSALTKGDGTAADRLAESIRTQPPLTTNLAWLQLIGKNLANMPVMNSPRIVKLLNMYCQDGVSEHDRGELLWKFLGELNTYYTASPATSLAEWSLTEPGQDKRPPITVAITEKDQRDEVTIKSQSEYDYKLPGETEPLTIQKLLEYCRLDQRDFGSEYPSFIDFFSAVKARVEGDAFKKLLAPGPDASHGDNVVFVLRNMFYKETTKTGDASRTISNTELLNDLNRFLTPPTATSPNRYTAANAKQFFDGFISKLFKNVGLFYLEKSAQDLKKRQSNTRLKVLARTRADHPGGLRAPTHMPPLVAPNQQALSPSDIDIPKLRRDLPQPSLSPSEMRPLSPSDIEFVDPDALAAAPSSNSLPNDPDKPDPGSVDSLRNPRRLPALPTTTTTTTTTPQDPRREIRHILVQPVAQPRGKATVVYPESAQVGNVQSQPPSRPKSSVDLSRRPQPTQDSTNTDEEDTPRSAPSLTHDDTSGNSSRTHILRNAWVGTGELNSSNASVDQSSQPVQTSTPKKEPPPSSAAHEKATIPRSLNIRREGRGTGNSSITQTCQVPIPGQVLSESDSGDNPVSDV